MPKSLIVFVILIFFALIALVVYKYFYHDPARLAYLKAYEPLAGTSSHGYAPGGGMSLSSAQVELSTLSYYQQEGVYDRDTYQKESQQDSVPRKTIKK